MYMGRAGRTKAVSYRTPKTMSEAVDAKCRAWNQIEILNERQKKLAQQKKLWKKRYRDSLKAMEKIALEAARVANFNHWNNARYSWEDR